MNTELNIINKTAYCVESNDCISKIGNCCEDIETPKDRSNFWYILPIILDDSTLCNNKNIIDINYLELVGNSLLSVKYDKKCYADIKNFENTHKDLFWDSVCLEDSYKMTFKIPNDKIYLCNIISKKGPIAINNGLFNKYFSKLF